MINIVINGIIIGILVSAPVGPLGILCIQRTLHKGRIYGIITGLGATTSDLIYAVLVGLGMNFIIDFVDQYRLLIQIFGCIILFFFGFMIYRTDPAKELENQNIGIKNRSVVSTYISAFWLCFSNPLIIFLFIGLFARFSFFASDAMYINGIYINSMYLNITGVISLLLGAFAWWVILTTIVGTLRNKFNVKGLRILNIITGSILMIISVAGVVLGLLGKTI
ncbi:MAG: LysE family translocator [Prevotellaceae bacterium]|jgi:threonine/homoserine/homoserine lactone efflux protein|nr:LysE family translocator [Prevotellaceae bacterium]